MTNPKLLRGRIPEAGGCYAITTVVHGRRPLLADPALAGIVAAEIFGGTHHEALESLAWVVMPDHVHWLFQLHSGHLSRCIQVMKSRSARAINAVLGSRGQVWQNGFYDHRLRDDEDLMAQARYIVANPIRRGLTQRIQEYPHWWCKWIARESDL